MAKPKAKTLQQRMGFLDEDLTKPKHDDLMFWLDDNIERIVNDLFYKPLTKSDKEQIIKLWKPRIDSIVFNLQNRIKIEDEKAQKKLDYINSLDLLNIENINKPRITDIYKKWELEVTTKPSYSTGSPFIVGYIDFVARFDIPEVCLVGLVASGNDHNRKDSDYHDFTRELGWSVEVGHKELLIEVKTEIKSLGELFRQINTYKTYKPGCYYVLCPDNKYKSKIEEQGIGFIEVRI